MLSILLASVMGAILGFTTHRAGICTVKAVTEVFTTGRAYLLLSFLKCTLWALGFLTLARMVSWSGSFPQLPWNATSIVGGVTFGIGAALNGGCVLSTASRAMDGELEFLLSILCWPVGALIVWSNPTSSIRGGNLDLANPLILALGIGLVFELGRIALRIVRDGGLGRAVVASSYTLSAAAALIGFAHTIILLTSGPWSISGTLICVGFATTPSCDRLMPAIVITVAALAGMAISSRQRGSFRLRVPHFRSTCRHGLAGTLMGASMAAIPGGNESLILFSFPSSSPHALPSYAGVLAGIFLALGAQRLFGIPLPKVVCTGDICRTEETGDAKPDA